MTTQPEALRLAEALDAWDGKLMMPKGWREQTSAELRRLHEANQELLEALESLGTTQMDRFYKQQTALKNLRVRLAQPEQSRAERMRDAGYTRRPTLRKIASEDAPEPKADAHLFYAPGDVLICKESDERVVVKHGNTGPMQLANGKIALEWSDEVYGEYTLEQIMDGFKREGYAPRREWVGLTLAEFDEIHDHSETLHEAMVDVVKTLREKNT